MTVTNNCTICLESLSNENTIRFEKELSDADCTLISQKGSTPIQVKCNHIFHASCLHAWLETYRAKTTIPPCPLCRSDLKDQPSVIPSNPPVSNQTQAHHTNVPLQTRITFLKNALAVNLFMKSTAFALLIALNETSNNEQARKIKTISSLLAINMVNETFALAILHSPNVNEQIRFRIAKQFLTLNLLTTGLRLAAVHSLSENTHDGQADLQIVRVVHRVILDHGQIGLGLARTVRIVNRHDEQAARIRSVKTILLLNELVESIAFAALYP